MARRNRESPRTTVEGSFENMSLVRDEASFSEFIAVEKLTSRPVRIVEVSSEVIKRKSEQDIEDFLRMTGRVTSLPFSSSLLRADRLGDGSLLLVVEPPLMSMTEFFGNPENRQFDSASTFVIRISIFLHGIHEMGFAHGGIRDTNISLDSSAAPSVWGAGLDQFCSLTSELSTMPMDATAPELLMGQKVTPASDLFGLGAVAYFAFIGQSWTNGFANVTDALLSNTPIKIAGCDAPSKAKAVIEQLLSRDPMKRPRSVEKIIDDLNQARVEMGLQSIRTGIEALDRKQVSMAVDDATWALGSIVRPAELDFSIDTSAATPTSAGIRDGAERGLSVFAISTGPRPKVVVVRNDAPAVGDIEDRPVPLLDWEERRLPVIEEWSPETKVDEWTVFAGDLAPVAVCSNGHRVAHGSQFCNFCGVSLSESLSLVDDDKISCPNGHLAPRGNAFCGVCGLAVEPDSAPELLTTKTTTSPSAVPGSPPPAVSVTTCLNGHDNPASDALCSTCGARIAVTLDTSGKDVSKSVPAKVEATTGLATSESDISFAELDTSQCLHGHPNTSTAAFCRECGSPVQHKVSSESGTEVTDDNLLYCRDGHPNREFARFCRWCAEPLESSESSPILSATSRVAASRPLPPHAPRRLPAAGDVAVIFKKDDVVSVDTNDSVLRAMSLPRREASDYQSTDTPFTSDAAEDSSS